MPDNRYGHAVYGVSTYGLPAGAALFRPRRHRGPRSFWIACLAILGAPLGLL